MAYNLQEQEQIDELKSFWTTYGNAILAAVTIALLVVAGVRGWGWYQSRQATAAAGIYAELTQAVESRNIEQVKQRSEDLLKQYGSTAYGQMTGLMAAAELAKNPGYDVADVARVLEYASSSHLSTTSQRIAGTRPASLARLRAVDLIERFLKGRARSRS